MNDNAVETSQNKSRVQCKKGILCICRQPPVKMGEIGAMNNTLLLDPSDSMIYL